MSSELVVSIAVFARVPDWDDVERLRSAINSACEDTIAPGYSIVIRTERNDGVRVDT